MKGDPTWITTRFPGKCVKCGRRIQPGQEAFYYPNGRKLLCEAAECGQDAAAEFAAARFDEDQMCSGFDR